ncbi:MAG: molybdenum cofactor guanylyltransferase [Nitrososphaerota archaeon]|jgi:molybdopterin-guanine dinucleotide biosynthesis protein A|nr:molybdenum cofactor guanylyltransferase [Nitrososphaerota archaeon]
MSTAAIILANESTPKGFSEDKGAMFLCNKPLIKHLFGTVSNIVDEVIIVVNTQERIDKYAEFLPKTTRFIIDKQQTQNPLSGAIAGFETFQDGYALLLPYDSPFVNKELVMLLLDLAVGKAAVVPRNADNEIEPLCAVYQTSLVLETAKQVAAEGVTDLQTFVEKLRGVRYVSKMLVEQLDPELCSFFSVSTPLDFKRATVMLEGKNKVQKSKR